MTASRIDNLQDDCMAVAWRDFVIWAASNPDMHEAFTRATGLRFLSPPRNAIDAAIDKATGARERIAEEFTRWVTETLWGIDDAPKAYRDAIAARGPRVTDDRKTQTLRSPESSSPEFPK